MNLIQSVRRLLRHPAQRAFEFKSKPIYWKILRRLQRVQHFVLVRRFRATEAARSVGQSSRIVAALSHQILRSVLVTVAVFCTLVVIDFQIEHGAVAFIQHYRPDLGALLIRLNEGVSRNYDDVQSFLNTVAQLAGLFLTLYFTAISLIASTVYARVPGDVRTLAVDEKVGNIYIRGVALLGALSILYLLAGVVGTRIGLVGLTVISGLSVASLFSFLFLGKRTFNFFQPAAFVDYVIDDLIRWIGLAASDKRATQTRSLQDYYRRRAGTTLGTWRNIVSLATKEEFHRIEADALLRILRGMVDAAVFYAERKGAISSSSLWFERISKHANWLTVSHVQLEMALQTGRAIDPEFIPNFLWVEERLEPILHEASAVLMVRDDSTPWLEFANRLYYRLEKLAHLFAVDEALVLFRSQRRDIASLLLTADIHPPGQSNESDRQLSFRLGALSFGLSYLMSISIGFTKRVEEITEDTIRALSDDFFREYSILTYSSHLPRAVLIGSETLLQSLHAERFVERQIFTPPWYVSQVLARSFIEYLKSTCLELVSTADETLQGILDNHKPNERYLVLAQAVSSGIELCDKFHAHLAGIRGSVEMLNRFRKVEDVPWTEIDWKALHERVAGIHRKLMLAAAEILLPLNSLPLSRYWPDFFGQIYSFVTRETYLSMEKGDLELFEGLFPSAFSASLVANQRLQTEFKGKDLRVALTWSTTPVQDIVELSGYAKLFSELDGKPFYDVVDRTWQNYLTSVKDAPATLAFVAAVLTYRTHSFGMAARDVERTAWQQSFGRLLRRRGLIDEHWGAARSPIPSHPSKLIREFTRGGSIGLEHASDVFLVDFVMPRVTGQSVEFPYTARNFAEALARDERVEEDMEHNE